MLNVRIHKILSHTPTLRFFYAKYFVFLISMVAVTRSIIYVISKSTGRVLRFLRVFRQKI